MILLLGGTADTDPFLEELHTAGFTVCLSQATASRLALVHLPEKHICGMLNEATLSEILAKHAITAIVDVTHPYAVNIKIMARNVAACHKIPYLRYLRAESTIGHKDTVKFARTHQEAADIACQPGTTVLLTVGSKNVAVYTAAAHRNSCRIIARVLDEPQSVNICIAAGVAECDIIAARGPFTVNENRAHLRAFNATVMVTKESGVQGGVEEKIEAAKLEGCTVIIVERPQIDDLIPFTSRDDLIQALLRCTT